MNANDLGLVVSWLRLAETSSGFADVRMITHAAATRGLWAVTIPPDAVLDASSAAIRGPDGITLVDADYAVAAVEDVADRCREATRMRDVQCVPPWPVRRVDLNLGASAEALLDVVIASLPTSDARTAASAVVVADTSADGLDRNNDADAIKATKVPRQAARADLSHAMREWSLVTHGHFLAWIGTSVAPSDELLAVQFVEGFTRRPPVCGWSTTDPRLIEIYRHEATLIVVMCALGRARRAVLSR